MISDTIEIDAGPAIDELKAFADAAKEAASSFADIGKGAALDVSASGPDKLVAAWDKAAASISASVDKIASSAAKLGDLSAAGGAGPDKLVAAWDDAAAQVSASVDKIAVSGAKLDDMGAGAGAAAGEVGKLGDALGGVADKGAGLGPAADGIKGIGTSADEAAAQLKALQDEMAATAAETDKTMAAVAAGSADRSASIAAAQRLNTTAMKAASDDAIAAQAAQADAAKQSAAQAEATAGKYHMLALGGAAVVGYGIDKAAQLQTQVTRLYTSAGESQKNLPMMTQGILGLSGQTATSQSELSSGAYMIESAGFHGQSALQILKAAAQGAKAEGAPLSEVGNALTSLMVSYGMKPQQATSAMNQIITMVGSGKMTMAGAVGALPAVLPVAAKSGLSFGQVGGALATMTATGMSPDWAAQMLRHTIGSVQNPSNVQTQEMQQLGINSVGLSKNLGKEGLTGAIGTVETAILHKMGPSGTVLLNSLNSSKLAAQSATQEIAQMPPSLRSGRAGVPGQRRHREVSADGTPGAAARCRGTC